MLNGLISHWKLNETGGTRADAHGANTLADNNTVLSGTGKLGGAADFEDTNNESLSVQSADFNFNGGDFTVAMWIKAESLTTTHFFIGCRDGASGPISFRAWIRATDISVDVFDGTTTSRASSVSSRVAGTWYFVVFGWDSSDGKPFLGVNNGSVVKGVVNNGPRNLVTPILYLGWSPDQVSGVGDFDGLIDSVSVWDRVLAAQETTWLFNSAVARDYDEFGEFSFIAELTSVQSRKITYSEGEAGFIDVEIVNDQPGDIDVNVLVTLQSGALDLVQISHPVTVPSESTIEEAIPFTASTLYGTKVSVVLESGGDTFTDYFAVHDDFFAVGVGYPSNANVQTGNFATGSVNPAPADMRAKYCNLIEMLFWGPDDFAKLVSPLSKWWSSQTDYPQDETNTLNLVQACHDEGIYISVYANVNPSGPFGWELAREKPYLFLSNAFNQFRSVNYDVEHLEKWNDADWRSVERSTGWYVLFADKSDVRLVDFGADQLIQSIEHYGWDFVRYDGHFTVTGDDEVSDSNMSRLIDTVQAEVPAARFGFNYGRSPQWSVHNGYTREMQTALGYGSMYMQEGVSDFYHTDDRYTSWDFYATNELAICKTLQGLGGHYYHITNAFLFNDATAVHKIVYALIAGAHDVYGGAHAHTSGAVPGCDAWGAFQLRWSGFLWAREIVLVANPTNLIEVEAEAIHWENILQERVLSTTTKVLINHLVNPPITDVIEDTDTLPTEISTSFNVWYTPQSGETVSRVVLVRPDQDQFELELATTDDMGRVRVTVPSLLYWGILLWEIDGTFTLYATPEPPEPPEQTGEGGELDPLLPPAIQPGPTKIIHEIDGPSSGNSAPGVGDIQAANGLAQRRSGSNTGIHIGKSFIGPVRAGTYRIGFRLKHLGADGEVNITDAILFRLEITSPDTALIARKHLYANGYTPLPGGPVEELGDQNEYAYYWVDIEVPSTQLLHVTAYPAGGTHANMAEWLDQIVFDVVDLISDADLAITSPITKPGGLRTPLGSAPVTALLVKGLFSDTYGLDNDDFDTVLWGSMTDSGLLFDADTDTLYEDIYQYDVIVLSNIDLTTSVYETRTVIRDWVNDGGRLVLLGGMYTWGQGAFAETFFEDLLPFHLDGVGQVTDAPVSVTRGFVGQSSLLTGTIPVRHQLAMKDDAEYFLIGDMGGVLGAKMVVGNGVVYAYSGTTLEPLADESEVSASDFYSSPTWGWLLNEMIFGTPVFDPNVSAAVLDLGLMLRNL